MNDNDIHFAELLKRSYKPNYSPKEATPILTVQNTLVGRLGSFVAYTGLPSAGKSTYINAIIAAGLTNESRFEHSVNRLGRKIAYFDTESSEHDFYNNISRINKISGTGIDENRLFACWLRGKEIKVIQYYIELYCIRENPSIVIIDGLLDLINDFNNIGESAALVRWLKVITTMYNILIITVIHEGKKDFNTLGHLGSMVDRYAESVISIERDTALNLYIARPKKQRNAPIWFEGVGVHWNGSGYQTTPAPPLKTKK